MGQLITPPKVQHLDSEQLRDIGLILEHLGQTDHSAVHVFEAEVGLMTPDGVYVGKAIWNSDTEIWYFEATSR